MYSRYQLSLANASYKDLNPFSSYLAITKNAGLLAGVIGIQLYAGALLYACSADELENDWLNPLGPELKWFFSSAINQYISLGYNLPLHIYYTLMSLDIFTGYWREGQKVIKNHDLLGSLHWATRFFAFSYILYASVLVYTGLSDENAESCAEYNQNSALLRLFLVGLGFGFFNASGANNVKQLLFSLLSHPYRHLLMALDFLQWSPENQAPFLKHWGEFILRQQRNEFIDQQFSPIEEKLNQLSTISPDIQDCFNAWVNKNDLTTGEREKLISAILAITPQHQSHPTAKSRYWYIVYPLLTLDIGYLFTAFSRAEAENGYGNLQLFFSLLVNMAIAFIAANNLWDAFISILWPDKIKGSFIHHYTRLSQTYSATLTLFFIGAALSGGAVYNLILTFIAHKLWAVLIGVPGLIAFNTSGFSDLIIGLMSLMAMFTLNHYHDKAPAWAKHGAAEKFIAYTKSILKEQAINEPMDTNEVLTALKLPKTPEARKFYASALAQLFTMGAITLCSWEETNYPSLAIFSSAYLAKITTDLTIDTAQQYQPPRMTLSQSITHAYKKYSFLWASFPAAAGFGITAFLLFYGHFVKTGGVSLDFKHGVLPHLETVMLGMFLVLLFNFLPKPEKIFSNNAALLFNSENEGSMRAPLITPTGESTNPATI